MMTIELISVFFLPTLLFQLRKKIIEFCFEKYLEVQVL
jgi:hypothetical protein